MYDEYKIQAEKMVEHYNFFYKYKKEPTAKFIYESIKLLEQDGIYITDNSILNLIANILMLTFLFCSIGYGLLELFNISISFNVIVIISILIVSPLVFIYFKILVKSECHKDKNFIILREIVVNYLISFMKEKYSKDVNYSLSVSKNCFIEYYEKLYNRHHEASYMVNYRSSFDSVNFLFVLVLFFLFITIILGLSL